MKPSVASHVSDFLKPDMLHVYRQITALRRVTPWVMTHRRENAGLFPFPEKRLIVLPKPRLRWWRRFVAKHLRHEPWTLFRWELQHALLELTRAEAKLLHIYFGHIAVHLRPLIKAFPHPVVVSFHGADAGVDMDKPAHLLALREVFASATVVQARSESLVLDLVSLGCPQEKLRVQRTGIPLEEWQFLSRGPRGEKHAWRILQSCRLVKKKGVDLTLRAFAQIKAQHENTTLVIAGDGPETIPLQTLARELGIMNSVRFTGFLSQDQLREEVRQADIFLHPSRTTADGNREGIPNSMLEAMASGACIVATRHGGIPEAISDDHSGLLVAENDVPAIVQALARIFESPGLSNRLAQAARTVIEDKFDRDKNIRSLEDCYLALIDGKNNRS